MKQLPSPFALMVLFSIALLTGCAPFQRVSTLKPQTKPGRVHGGQQPVTGATVQVYAVGTANDGSAATPLLTPAVTSDANGEFVLPNGFCPSPSTLVYIVATGGNPGLAPGTNNAGISLMAAIGPCSNITTSTFINIDELTTVAAVWALAPYMSSYRGVGSGTGDAAGLANAFTLASELANITTGTVPGLNVPAGATVPLEQINTLADILAACVNSAGGVAGDGSVCGTLFSATTPSGGVAPTDVIGAGINIADNPNSNIPTLFGLSSSFAPYQPTLTSPPANYMVQLTLPSALSISPSSLTFPATVLFISSAPQTVTVANTGTAAVPIYGVTMTGTNANDFTQVNTCPESLAAGASCSVQVKFTPSAAGTRSAYLNIADGSPNPLTTAALTGTTTTNPGGQAGPVTVSPSTLTFTQTATPQQVTLSNLGPTPLAILSYNLSSGYTQTNTCGGSLGGQSTCTISITLNDPSVGATAALVVFDDATSGYQVVQLNIPVTNGTPNYGLTTSTPLFFGAENVGVVSPTQSFFAYSGSHSGTNLSGSITGADANDFYFVNGINSCVGGVNGCSLALAFKPTAAGFRTATLSTNYGSVSLNGVGNPGGPAAFLLSPPLVTLTSGLSGTITVSNIGGTTLDLSEAVGGPNTEDFQFYPQVSATTCGSTLASGTSCQLSVEVAATGYSVVGERAATFMVTDTLSGLQHSVYMVANETYLPPVLPNNSLNFSYDTQVGSQSAPQTTTATAPDGHALTMQLVQGASYFKIVSPTYCADGTSCPITVVFLPTSTGSVSGEVLVTDTVTGLTNTVSLFGVGGVPQVTLSNPTLQFVARNVGSTSTALTSTLTNTGNALLIIQGVSIMGANTSDFQETNSCPTVLSPGNSCTISATFTPNASGPRTAYIQILSNASSSPDVIQLTGTGN